MFSTDEQKRAFVNAIKEISNSMVRTEAERDLIKEIVKEQSEELEIPKSLIKKVANAYHKQNRKQVEEEYDEFLDLYDEIFKESA